MTVVRCELFRTDTLAMVTSHWCDRDVTAGALVRPRSKSIFKEFEKTEKALRFLTPKTTKVKNVETKTVET